MFDACKDRQKNRNRQIYFNFSFPFFGDVGKSCYLCVLNKGGKRSKRHEERQLNIY